MSDEYAVGIIGYGLAGSVFHAPIINATPGLKLTAVVTKDTERGQSAQALYPGVRVVANTDELWDLDLDIVAIATPNASHASLALAAIQNGIAVVVDKPLALNPAQAHEVIEAARAEDVLLTVFQNRRWDGDFLTVRKLVDDGTLGRVARFESRFERWRPNPKGGWRETVPPEQGGGTLFDLGSHLIDQAVVLFGPVAEVYGEVDITRAGVSVDDDCFVALTHESGTRSHLFMSAAAPNQGPRFRVLGTKAGYVSYGLDPQEQALRDGAVPGADPWGVVPKQDWGLLYGDGQTTPVPTEPGNYPAFYAAVAAALANRELAPVDPTDAELTLQIIDAARRSSDTTSVISL